ncbi:nucleotidyltransferase family protein [Roseovarius ramblicola]|uniref:NTP transferase domain-containing protein n=1 Tax=Roseovarius ramblicola TaxID=2022336 RepID=A0ABV5I210_9RHOB
MSGAVAILVPAAGASRRMRGRDKLMEEVRGRALLADRVAAALDLGGEVLVTLPPGGDARARALAPLTGPRLWLEEVPEAGEGMAASLRRGADWATARGAGALMVLLPDLPDLTVADLRAVLGAFDGVRILRATAEDGRVGHPVVFPARYLPEMATLRGDAGARAILAAHEVAHVALPGARAVTDLDTPEDWAAWRAGGMPKP